MEDTSLESNEYQEIEEIPEFFQPGYVERVVDALPYYFPNYLKERLKREHPDIPVTTKESNKEGRELLYLDRFIPYYRGALHLNEILAESLTLSILTEINDFTKTNTPYIENLFEPFLSDYGRNNTTFELIQHMQVAMLSGDFRQTNRFLKEKYHISLYQVLSYLDAKIKDKIYLSQQNEKDKSVVVGSFYPYEGKIYINPLYQENLSLCWKIVNISKVSLKLARLNFAWKEAKREREEIQQYEEEKKKEYATIAGIGIHETIHYLSYDSREGRLGFAFNNQSDLYRLSKTY